MTDAKTQRYWRGVCIALLAALSWGFMSPIVKLIAAAGVSLMSAMVVRGLFTAAIMGAWLCCTRGRSVFCQPRRVMRYYLLSGFLTVVCAGCGYLMSLEYLTVAEAMIIHYSFPLVTMLGALWVTREKPTRLQVLAGFLIVAGVFAGLGGGGNFAAISLSGVLWGLLAVAGISGQTLVARRAALDGVNDQASLLFFSHLFGGLAILCAKSAFLGWGDLALLTPYLALLLALQALCGSLVGYGLFYVSLKYIPAPIASLLCTLEMVVAVILTALIVGQSPTLHETLGCAVLIAAIVCAAVKPRESASNSHADGIN